MWRRSIPAGYSVDTIQIPDEIVEVGGMGFIPMDIFLSARAKVSVEVQG